MGGDSEACSTEVKRASTDALVFPRQSWIAARRFLQLQLIGLLASSFMLLREVLAPVVGHRCSVLIMAGWRVTSHLSSCSNLDKNEKRRTIYGSEMTSRLKTNRSRTFKIV